MSTEPVVKYLSKNCTSNELKREVEREFLQEPAWVGTVIGIIGALLICSGWVAIIWLLVLLFWSGFDPGLVDSWRAGK